MGLLNVVQKVRLAAFGGIRGCSDSESLRARVAQLNMHAADVAAILQSENARIAARRAKVQTAIDADTAAREVAAQAAFDDGRIFTYDPRSTGENLEAYLKARRASYAEEYGLLLEGCGNEAEREDKRLSALRDILCEMIRAEGEPKHVQAAREQIEGLTARAWELSQKRRDAAMLADFSKEARAQKLVDDLDAQVHKLRLEAHAVNEETFLNWGVHVARLAW